MIKENNPQTTLLHNDALEQAILGTILQYGTATFENVSKEVAKEMFYVPSHSLIYGIMEDAYKAGEDVTMASVAVKFNETQEGVKNPMYVLGLIDYNDLAKLEDNTNKLKDLYQRRQLYNIGLKLSDVGISWERETDEAKQEAIEAIKSLNDCKDTNITSLQDAFREVYGTMNDNASGTGKRGFATGFREIDARGGFMPSDLVVIAAESSQGKTSFAIDVAVNAAKSGVPVAVYSLEMQKAQLAARIVSAETKVNSRLIMNERLNGNETKRIDEAMGAMWNLPIYFDDNSTISVGKIYSSIRQMARKKGVKVAVIDYLQILSTNQRLQNLETFYGEVSRNLKNLAKELNICVVLLSQLSRDMNTPEPSLSRLRGSGQINEAADMTFLIYRPEVYGKNYPKGAFANVETKGTALIKCAKGRNVGTYEFVCGFDAESTHFHDLEQIPKLKIEIPGL
jgi:replicative DNA helicase